MEPVVEQKNLKYACTLSMVETEEVHRRIVHSHELPDVAGLLRHEEVAMDGRSTAEHGTTQVEIVAGIFKVWEETQETRRTHEEHQMEIGKRLLTTVKPLNA